MQDTNQTKYYQEAQYALAKDVLYCIDCFINNIMYNRNLESKELSIACETLGELKERLKIRYNL